ncbi:glutaredoxin family protein [Stieleria varia]|nr:glutaredoxin family protein [Stieleria varia]
MFIDPFARLRLSAVTPLVFLFALLSYTPTTAWSDDDAANVSAVHTVQMEVFLRSDLPKSAETIAYIEHLKNKRPGLDVVVHDVLKDREQLARLYALTQRFGRPKPVVPSFYSCRQMYYGFLDAQRSGPGIEALLTMDVYTRDTCPKCQEAKRFLPQLKQRWPAIEYRIHEITGDDIARARWHALSSAVGGSPGLPTFDFAGRVIVGYSGDATTGRQLEDWIREVASEPSAKQPAGKPDDKPPPKPSQTKPSQVQPGLISLINVLQAAQAPDALSETSDSNDSPVMEFPEFELPGEATEGDVGAATLQPPEEASGTPSDTIELPWFGPVRVTDMGLPLFTFIVGLVDGFNPCAMWILVFLLSILVNIKDRRKIIMIAGTFVVVSGLAYYAFMAAWLSMFLLIGIVRPVQIALGLIALTIGVINVKDFFAFKKGVSLSIPEKSKPGLYRRVREIAQAKYMTAALAGVVVLAVVVNMVELLCTAGLPALYTQILTLQDLPAWQNYLYLGLYILAYMLDDSILLGITVVTLSNRKMQEREGRWLKLLSGLVILVLGLVMIFRPSWLTLVGH